MPSLEELVKWRDTTPDLLPIMWDYHRLQVEHFCWRETHALAEGVRVLDIGIEYRKPYLEKSRGPGYVTVNYDDATRAEWIPGWTLPLMSRPHVLGDIQSLPFSTGAFNAVLCTEVLEHVPYPWGAVEEIRRVLCPGGVALLTSPFMWPWHGSKRYADFWRFTADGWRMLCRDFSSVRVFPQEFTDEAPLAELMAAECMGTMGEVRLATGYAVKAVR